MQPVTIKRAHEAMWSDNETVEDLLKFDHLSDAVINLVTDIDLLPVTVGVFGDWGSGKSSLLKMVSKGLEDEKSVVVLSFNGWIFEGFEDAKTALMGSVLEALLTRQSLPEKAKRLACKLFKRVNLMRAGLSVTKALAAFSIAGPAGAVASGAFDAAAMAKEITTATKEMKEEDVLKYLKEEPDQPSRKGVSDFRKEFEELLSEITEISTLVVMIDDLDRCLPETIIETLEAIKLFLFVPKTAFVLGADERLVKYAVKKRFPELPGEKTEVGRDYLEKLIQFPVRVPALGRAELETYIALLFSQIAPITKEQFNQLKDKAIDSKSVLDVRLNLGIVKEVLGTIKDDFKTNLELGARIAPVLAAGLAGNPRQCKRFLNTLMMRLKMAETRKIDLNGRVLAKLMLLEYFKSESFRKLAEMQAFEDGFPKELASAEKILRPSTESASETASSPNNKPSKSQKTNDKTDGIIEQNLPGWALDEWVQNWIRMDPLLSSEDLRSYFFFSRDLLGPLAGAAQRMTPLAQELLANLLSGSSAVRSQGVKKLADLSPADANALFEAIAEKCRYEEDMGVESSLMPRLFDVVTIRRELFSQLLMFLTSVDDSVLPVSVVPKVIALVKTDEEKRLVRDVIKQWASGSSNSFLQKAAAGKVDSL